MLDELIAAASKQESQKALADQTFVIRQGILGELAPRLWTALRLSIRNWCQKYPDRFTFEVQPNTCAVVRTKSNALEVEYQEQSKRVFYRAGDVEGVFRIRLNESDDAVFVDGKGLPFTGPDYVAEVILATLLA